MIPLYEQLDQIGKKTNYVSIFVITVKCIQKKF